MNDRRLNAEKEYWINFTEHNKKFCLSLHYNGKNSYIFVNGADMHIIKGKDSEIKTTLVYLGSISKDFSIDSTKNNGFHGYVYDFNVVYDAIVVDNILDIHKYLMKRHNI